MEVAPEKIGVPVSQSGRKNKKTTDAALASSVHSLVSHKDDRTWTSSEEKVENRGMKCMINARLKTVLVKEVSGY